MMNNLPVLVHSSVSDGFVNALGKSRPLSGFQNISRMELLLRLVERALLPLGEGQTQVQRNALRGDSLSVVEALIASQVCGKTNCLYSACSFGELAYADHFRPNGNP